MMQRNVSPWKVFDLVLNDLERTQGSRSNLQLDVVETADSVLVIANLPGVKPENVTVTLKENILTLEASSETTLPEGAKVLHAERNVSAFKRSIRIPVRLSADEVEAKLEQGALTVTLKKAVDATPKRITVQG
jgi:HSP20 family protein